MWKKYIVGGVIIMLALTVGCSTKKQNEENGKLFFAVTGNNLQGVKEVIRSDEPIDFLDLGYYDTTPFSVRDGRPKKDGRALALALQNADDEADEVAGTLIEAGAPVSDSEDTYTYLNEAVGNHSFALCKQLIEKGADVNAGEETPLEGLLVFVHPAMEDAQVKAELLIEHGARIDKKLMENCLRNDWRYLYAPKVLRWLKSEGVPSGLEPGLEAAISGDDAVLQSLVKDDRIQNKKDVLQFAAAHCGVETLEQMKNQGYDFFTEDEAGMNILHIAALYNTKEVVAFLLENGVDGKAIAEAGWQPITYAAVGAKEETLRFLLKQGYRYQKGETYTYREGDETTVWTWVEACQFGSAKSVDVLLDAGYKPTKEECSYGYATDIDSVFYELLKCEIPYNFALEEEFVADGVSEKHLAELIHRGAKVSNQSLCNAIMWRNYGLLQELLKKEIKQSNKEEASPLIQAIRIGDLKSVRYLVEDGADVNQMIECEEGKKMPLHIAAEYPSADILKYLIEQGGNTKAKDSRGNLPYDYAKGDEGFRENMELLK